VHNILLDCDHPSVGKDNLVNYAKNLQYSGLIARRLIPYLKNAVFSTSRIKIKDTKNEFAVVNDVLVVLDETTKTVGVKMSAADSQKRGIYPKNIFEQIPGKHKYRRPWC
jgi:hypothetical protein